MIDPRQCASQILDTDPELADPLYDLIIWIREAKGALSQAQMDQLEADIYSRTHDAETRRTQYRKMRLKIPPGKRKLQTAELTV